MKKSMNVKSSDAQIDEGAEVMSEILLERYDDPQTEVDVDGFFVMTMWRPDH